jgi:NitT/TauT family transport system substrate-binding protein
MKPNHIFSLVAIAAIALFGFSIFGQEKSEKLELRLGYFPNVTHAQAIIGVARGDFQKAIGNGVKLKPILFNAGPSVIEAIYGGNLDIAYIGPSPALNGFLKSNGEEVRVISGAADNGVLIIASQQSGIKSLDQLRGKRIATPQLGNTQDISAKAFVQERLHTKLKDQGGDTEVIPVKSSDLEILFAKNQIDAAWVPEPWGSWLVERDHTRIIGEEKELWPHQDFALTSIIVRRAFLEKHADIVRAFLKAHTQLTSELAKDPMPFIPQINSELKRLTGKALPPSVIRSSFEHTSFTTELHADSYQRFYEMGRKLGYIKSDKLDLATLMQPQLNREVQGTRDASYVARTSHSDQMTTAAK